MRLKSGNDRRDRRIVPRAKIVLEAHFSGRISKASSLSPRNLSLTFSIISTSRRCAPNRVMERVRHGLVEANRPA